MNNLPSPRRRFIKSSAFGLISITAFGYSSAQGTAAMPPAVIHGEPLFYRYPGMNDEMVSSIVGASHGNFDKVKELVSQRPELAGAAWDWGFGDWETALGAASHVGRRDIAEFLISNGARPDIFTFTMMGMLKAVQEMVETVPGIQSHTGPHGITLLQHAKNRLEAKNISASDRDNVNKVISYLEGLGNADMKPKSLAMTDEEKKMFFGEYRFGAGEAEIFVVDQHRLGFLQIGRKGSSPRKLNKVDENTFSPAGAASVKIIFKMNNDKAISLSVHEPEPLVVATRI
ncbi:hypothetical protein [Terrimonas pollutisoli]|uniref:hypothetical protein n=1 Tax=Terrimonas pollutisoli TaxID=3034147 RepID=UPI0023EDA2E8|nr:hypothetical protein [Terrimonas sp. H1YJ31]